MLSFQPSIMVGSYHWNEERVPRDEYQARRRALDEAMDANGWKAVLIYGDAREHAALAYYSSFIPRLRWGMAIIPRAGEPLLLCSNSSRDVPSMKLMTWIPDVRSGWEWAKHVDPYLAKIGADVPADLGIIGLDLIAPVLRAQLDKSLGNRFRLTDADSLFQQGRALRPRETTLVRESCTLASAAAQAMHVTWTAGRGAAQASLAAERHARLAGAQDVRILISGDGGRTLSPTLPETSNDALLGYVGVKVAGFWSELFVSASRGPSPLRDRAMAGLDAALAVLKPGVEAGTVYAAAIGSLGAIHPVLCGSVGWRIGLSPDEGGSLRTGNTEKLTAGTIYALHAGTQDGNGGAIVSAMVALNDKGAAVLCRSPGCPKKGKP
jgi:Xaa-Pro aminopeptidase